MSSIATTTILHDQNEIYHYTRSALEGLVKYYACTLGKMGVRVNCIQPSKLIKPENKKYFLKKKNTDRKILEKITPLKRMGKSEDIANLTLFLTSDASSFITGTIIPVDGGLRLLSQESIYRIITNKNKCQKVFITGGGGYVGCYLTDYLISFGYSVTVYDLFIYGENVFKSKDNLNCVKGDIRDQELLTQSIAGHDIVIHLACIQWS